jgi:asparagine synthase (glutamine-hydrolysing)
LKYKLSGFQESQSVDENSLLKKKRKLSQISAGKQIFRETMEKIIPTEVTKFKKQGFSSPDASWFKAESLIFLQNKFKKSNNVIFEFTDYNVFKRKLDEHVNGVKNNRLFIWSYIYLDSYLENIMSDEII